MRTALIVSAGLAGLSSIALAAADIPTRYSGAFPSIGRATNITGTFTGNALALRYTVVRPEGPSTYEGQYACRTKSSSASRCDGRWTNVRTGFSGRNGVDIRWKAGKPTYFHIDKPKRS